MVNKILQSGNKNHPRSPLLFDVQPLLPLHFFTKKISCVNETTAKGQDGNYHLTLLPFCHLT